MWDRKTFSRNESNGRNHKEKINRFVFIKMKNYKVKQLRNTMRSKLLS